MICTGCGRDRPRSDFLLVDNPARPGHQMFDVTQCVSKCIRAAAELSRKKRLYARQWRKKHPMYFKVAKVKC